MTLEEAEGAEERQLSLKQLIRRKRSEGEDATEYYFEVDKEVFWLKVKELTGDLPNGRPSYEKELKELATTFSPERIITKPEGLLLEADAEILFSWSGFHPKDRKIAFKEVQRHRVVKLDNFHLVLVDKTTLKHFVRGEESEEGKDIAEPVDGAIAVADYNFTDWQSTILKVYSVGRCTYKRAGSSIQSNYPWSPLWKFALRLGEEPNEVDGFLRPAQWLSDRKVPVTLVTLTQKLVEIFNDVEIGEDGTIPIPDQAVKELVAPKPKGETPKSKNDKKH